MSTNNPHRSSAMWRLTAGVGLIGLVGFTAILTLPSVSATNSDRVTVCHGLASPTDPYTATTIDIREAAAGSAAGQAIGNADCDVIAASPTPTPPASTPTPTPTPTVITSPTIDGITRPQPLTTPPPDLGTSGDSGGAGNVGNPSESGAPLGVDAGGGPSTPERSAWLWLIPATFLALFVASMRQIITQPRRDSSR